MEHCTKMHFTFVFLPYLALLFNEKQPSRDRIAAFKKDLIITYLLRSLHPAASRKNPKMYAKVLCR